MVRGGQRFTTVGWHELVGRMREGSTPDGLADELFDCCCCWWGGSGWGKINARMVDNKEDEYHSFTASLLARRHSFGN